MLNIFKKKYKTIEDSTFDSGVLEIGGILEPFKQPTKKQFDIWKRKTLNASVIKLKLNGMNLTPEMAKLSKIKTVKTLVLYDCALSNEVVQIFKESFVRDNFEKLKLEASNEEPAKILPLVSLLKGYNKSCRLTGDLNNYLQSTVYFCTAFRSSSITKLCLGGSRGGYFRCKNKHLILMTATQMQNLKTLELGIIPGVRSAVKLIEGNLTCDLDMRSIYNFSNKKLLAGRCIAEKMTKLSLSEGWGGFDVQELNPTIIRSFFTSLAQKSQFHTFLNRKSGGEIKVISMLTNPPKSFLDVELSDEEEKARWRM